MTDANPFTAGSPTTARRRLPLFALVGLVAIGAGGTGALAATVTRHSDVASTPSPAPSVYIPYTGMPGAGGAAGSIGPPTGVVQGQAAPGAPMVAQSANPGPGYPYPYPGPGICTGGAPMQAGAQVITTTGTSAIGVGTVSPVYVLYGSVNDQTTGDVSHAVSDVQQRLSAVVDALVHAGVPRSSIRTSSVNVYAGGGRAGSPVPTTGRPTVTTTVNASASLSAQLPDAGAVDAAVSGATGAGADSVNVSTQTPPVSTPSTDALSAALTQAADQAHQLASATAKATGVTLGAVRSVSTQQPTLCGYGVDGPQLVVAVTVSYAIG